MKAALKWLVAGVVLGGYGLTLWRQAGPCTVMDAVASVGLMIGSVACGVYALIFSGAALRDTRRQNRADGPEAE